VAAAPNLTPIPGCWGSLGRPAGLRSPLSGADSGDRSRISQHEPVDANELAAAEVVATCTGGRVIERDVLRAPDSTVDFDIELPSGELLALEVTTHVDRQEAEMASVAHKYQFDAPALSRSWSVTIQTSTRLNGLQERLVPLLQQMERRGSEVLLAVTLTPEEGQREPPDVTVLLARAGVVAAGSRPAPLTGPVVSLARTPSTSDVARFAARAVLPDAAKGVCPPAPNPGGPDQRRQAAVLAAIEQELEANKEKLGRSTRYRRELWIWCDTLLTRLALRAQPPKEVPSLPAEITAVWVALRTDTDTRYWRFQAGEGWARGQL
jgi:hypothetical protein